MRILLGGFFKISMICLYKSHEVKIKMEQQHENCYSVGELTIFPGGRG